MFEYFSIMLKENSDQATLDKLSAKLAENFTFSREINIGRNTLLVLQKYTGEQEATPTRRVSRAVNSNYSDLATSTPF